MKRIISAMLAVCMVMLLLPAIAVQAAATGMDGAENCMQLCVLYDESTGEVSDNTSAVLFQLEGQNFIVSTHVPSGDQVFYHTVAGDEENLGMASYAGTLGMEGLHVYLADESYGKAQGFISVGSAQEGEMVTILYLDDADTLQSLETLAGSVEGHILNLPNVSGSLNRAGAVVNSRNELCAIYFDQEKLAYALLDTDSGSNGSGNSGSSGDSNDSGSSGNGNTAGKPSACLQGAWYYDEETGDYGQWSSAILVDVGGYNLMVTTLAPREDRVTIYSVESSDYDYYSAFNSEAGYGVYFYDVSQELTKEEGFCPVGYVQPGETVSLVYWETEHSRKIVQATAAEMPENYILTLEGVSVNANYLLPVLNSNNEVCAFYIPSAGVALSAVTDQNMFYGNGGSGSQEDPDPQQPEDETPSSELGGTRIEYPVDLERLDDIYAGAVNEKKPNKTGYIVVGVIAVAAVALVAAVVLVGKKKKREAELKLDDVDEGTDLADGPADTGIRLQFRNGTRLAVTGGITIGRAADNTVVIPSTSSVVSGRHCELLVQNDAVYLRDLGSTNGTYINGKRLVSGQLVQLLPGMIVGLGEPKGNEMFAVTESARR